MEFPVLQRGMTVITKGAVVRDHSQSNVGIRDFDPLQ